MEGKPAKRTILQTAQEEPEDLFVVHGQTKNITSLTFIYRSECGVANPMTPELIRKYWFGLGATVQQYFETCSYGQLRFPEERNKVIGPVDIPCAGTAGGYKYDLANGNGMGNDPPDLEGELWALPSLALEHLQKAVPACRPGDFDRCNVWMNPEPRDGVAPDVMTVFHEILHNIGLRHSAGPKCDDSGCWIEQSYKLGWSHAVSGGGEIQLVKLVPGTNYEYTLPAAANSNYNMLRIMVPQEGMPAGQERAVFVSYRVRPGPGDGTLYDSGLTDDQDVSLRIHEYNETANEAAASQSPLLLATLSLGGPASEPGRAALGSSSSYHYSPLGAQYGLKVTMASGSAAFAHVVLCAYEHGKAGGASSCGMDEALTM
ncbi:hypothetical protein GPECTOR_4g645 [Gonium pectorale]|uniref:Peptidase M11 gametolysin domain-containing protein n=1 Tax=Gonium pectorale TaxID=33097 RepID=A0A150GZ18_GONPE|nr:hypothetical protein GPECTOR_4g645 [Gonium pectorale]|eukprot:KXZ54580.1 hypothetical protein GPECTOR_4g645 [Gonium pectorale]